MKRPQVLQTSGLCAAVVSLLACAFMPAAAQAPATPPPYPQVAPALVPDAIVNLMTADGSALFGAQWKTMEAKIAEVPAINGHMPGYDKTYDIVPHAGESGFDDSAWPTIAADTLPARRGGGKVSFLWFRALLTIPAKVGNFDTSGTKAVFTAYIDDYAEVWVNGQMPRRPGIPSPSTIQGVNMPNRVVLADSVKAGDKFQVAVFAINGPISVAPTNFIFFRDAKVEFYK